MPSCTFYYGDTMPIREHLLPEVMFRKPVIKNVDRNGDGKIDGYQFQLGNPYYTANPISSISDFILDVDGEAVPLEKITFILRGQEIDAKKAYTFYDVSWGFADVMEIFVEKSGGLRKGNHEVSLLLKMRETIHYGYPDGKVPFQAKRTMNVTV